MNAEVRPMIRRGKAWPMLVAVWAALWGPCAITVSQERLHDELRTGDEVPTGWHLSGGRGRWVDRQWLEVTGDGQDSNFWGRPCRLTPVRLYRFEMRARQTQGTGCVVSGPARINRDYRLSSEWTTVHYVFRVPDVEQEDVVRLGQWHMQGTVQFDSVRLAPVLPVHREFGALILGQGEELREGVYKFHGTFGQQASNYHRVLQRATATFNSNRWCFGSDSQVVYRFALPDRPLQSFRAEANVNYHTGGGCRMDVSRDGQRWETVDERRGLGSLSAELSDSWFPAQQIWLRLRSFPGSTLQVDRIDVEAKVDNKETLQGRTDFAEIRSGEAAWQMGPLTWLESPIKGRPRLKITARPAAEGTGTIIIKGMVQGSDQETSDLPEQTVSYDRGEAASIVISLPESRPGEQLLTLRLHCDDVAPLELALPYQVHEYYRSDYGLRLASSDDAVGLWWCSATRKIPRERALPEASGEAVEMWAARNDREAVQIVLRPDRPLNNVRVQVSSLRGPNGAAIAQDHVDLLQVYYHYVHSPTDNTGVRDHWPDALPPWDHPISIPAKVNQPLWVRVRVPHDATAGAYRAIVTIQGDEFRAEIPLVLHVWDFALPERNHLETAFGFSTGNIIRYHGLRTEEQKRKVLDAYMRSFAEHRISPYDPAPLDPIEARFVTDSKPPRVELDFEKFDRAMYRAVNEYHFTNFRLRLQGMGGGTFHSRVDPRIGPFGEDTDEYQRLFADYAGRIERHLREHGWLDMAFVYWFDEPDPKDYEFVRRGMERIKKYAPGLTTMLTEQPEPALAGPIDIWCPVSHNYDHDAAEQRREHGERFWWYVCTGPKAPYCTLFIDHPATELRVWLWQTWQRKISGILVWSSNYWTSSAAFPDPDHPQNPYEDPMGYRSGYSTPPGTKLFWGNGDGRFIYPPLAAATPGATGDEPVLESPVDSIRWEMLREGIEDYEFLYRLRELLKAKGPRLPQEQYRRYRELLEVPADITASMTEFTKDPRPIYRHRAAVAEAIETLTRM